MDEKSRIQAATILQGIVKGYMNPVRHMSADDESYEKWMRLVEKMDQEYAKDPFFEQVMVSLTAEGYLPGGEAGLGYKPARNLLDQWQIEDVIQEFYNPGKKGKRCPLFPERFLEQIYRFRCCFF